MRTAFPLTLLLAMAPLSAGAAEILNEGSFWRFHVTVRKPVVREGSAARVIPVYVAYRSYPGISQLVSPPAPAKWAAPDFDDSAWPRAPLSSKHRGASASIDRIAFAPGITLCTFRVCLRGKFAVANPAAVKELSLSLKYRGGVVVYLNGREVARKNMPAGKLSDETPADPYPEEVWVTSKGKVIPDYRARRKLTGNEKTDVEKRLARRDSRSLGPVKLPVAALRRGVNVLAVEVRRSDYHTVALAKRWPSPWTPLGLSGLKLQATGDGVTPNVSRPRGFQVWNHDLNNRATVEDYADPHEKLEPVRLIGARNGTFSGMVAAGSTSPLRGLKVTASDLTAARGGGKIPAGNVLVRYGMRMSGRHNPDWFDGLVAAAPAEVALHNRSRAAVQPVLISVRVPADAAPGAYKGKVTVSAAGVRPVEVPLELSVSAWKLRDPKKFRCYIGIYQSPTSLAMQYKVREWSEKHWKLMEKSFAVLGQVGNKIVNVPLSDQTQFGNDEGMVYWVKKQGGGYDYDFKVFDRYLDLTEKHWGKPDFVALQVWHSWGWAARKADQKNTVTVIEKNTGKREHLQVPKFDTQEAGKFWKPVLDAIHARLKKRGWEKSMCIGILSDGTAPGPVFAMFDSIWPGGAPARWTRGCHGVNRAPAPYRVSRSGGIVVCHEYCYGMSMADPSKGLPALHKQRGRPGTAYIRHNFDHTLSLLKYRNMPERGLYCGTRGIGRICFDFWSVVKDSRGRSRNIYNRYPHSSCAQRAPSLYALSYPGPKGAEPTVRFENFRQGVQDTEALIFLSEAASEHAGKIGPELVARYKKLLTDRMNYCKQRAPEFYGRVHHRTNHLGGRELTARLYRLAGEVAQKLGQK